MQLLQNGDIVSYNGKKYEVIDVKMDGNCLFRCFALLMNGSEEDHHILRSEIVAWLVENREKVAPYLAGITAAEKENHAYSEADFDAFVENLKKDRFWGGNESIYAFAMAKNRVVSIRNPDGSEIIIQPKAKGLVHSGRKQTVHLYYTGAHYMVLSKID